MKMRGLIGVLAVVLLAAAEPEKDNEATRDKKKMQGAWEVVILFAQGEAKNPAGKRVVVKDNDMTLWDGDREFLRMGFKLDPVKDPKQIDFTSKPTEEQEVQAEIAKILKKEPPKFTSYQFQGIYSVDGDDQLVVAYSVPGQARPKEFATVKGDKVMVMKLKRAKPKE